MLVLTRRPGQRVMIGSDVKVTVLKIKGDQVVVGITAPIEVAVHRHEIFDRIQEGELVAKRL